MAGRGNWKNWYEFLFSCIGCLVGLGNIWRFPYLCYKNGGGAFLLPYFIFMILCAFPVFFLEMSYAQYSNLGPGRAWICVPLLRGVGYGMVLLTGIVAIYYNVIMAWTLYYFAKSFSSTLPWSTCNNDWNTDACIVRVTSATGNASVNATSASGNVSVNVTPASDNNRFNVTSIISTIANTNVSSNGVIGNGHSNNSMVEEIAAKILKKTPTEEFWEHNVLELTDGVEYPGYVRWQLFLCLLAAWTIVFLSLVRGIKSSGKVMYVAATLPYLLLLILLIRGCMLPGAWEGFLFFAWPRWDKLASFTVWGDAAVQMFYSAGMGWGGISTLASYNNFHNNLERDAVLLPILDCVTSFFSGCVIFVNLGYMAQSANIPIEEVVKQGPGIAFMVYPEALSQLPLPQLWSVLFFLMLFTVGLDSQIVHVQTLTSALMDTFPKQLYKRKLLVTSVVCGIMFLLGLSCITQGGIYVLQILDWYCASITVMFLAFMEMVGIVWIYGYHRLSRDVEMMLGRPLNRIWGVFWKFITPVIILVIWVFNLAQLTPVKYGDVTYPGWAIAIGWIVAFVSIVPLPVFMLLTLRRAKGTTLREKLLHSIRPSPAWKPADERFGEPHTGDLDRKHVDLVYTPDHPIPTKLSN